MIKKENLKLIICDIDWTLLSRNKRVLSPFTMDIVERMHKEGVMFGVASGRPMDEVFKVYKTWNLSFPVDVIIAMNGAEILDTHNDKLYEGYKLKKEWMKEICELVEPLNVNPYIYYHGAMKSRYYDEVMAQSAVRNEKELIVAKDLDDFANEDSGKIMIRCWEPERMKQLYDLVSSHPSENWAFFNTQVSLLEFADKRVSKGVALKQYCEKTGLDINDVIAFGDTTNDNEMIQNAGWGVCLLNGSDDTKEISDDITEVDVEEDGFAHYLAKHFYGE